MMSTSGNQAAIIAVSSSMKVLRGHANRVEKTFLSDSPFKNPKCKEQKNYPDTSCVQPLRAVALPHFRLPS
ncbi:MAG: hypothetical protein EA399_15505 [Desulfovibrionales bacterium]|nr:MAG: hypothetical protein EA399_15505 [Desulfovibrionales bacterium]